MSSSNRARNAAAAAAAALLLIPVAGASSPAENMAAGRERAASEGLVRSEVVNRFSACRASAAPSGSYAWPVKPFDRPHPVQGNFGDPRTIFLGDLRGGADAAGGFRFHNGVDISAPDGTAVYAVASGRVLNVASDHLAVRTDENRRFQYWHIAPVVIAGEHIVAKRTVLGFVLRPFEHVHLTEIDRGHVANPLVPGHLFPYRDLKPPRVDNVIVTSGGRVTHEGQPLSGTVTIAAAAHDVPSIAPTGRWHNAVVAPATVSWWLAATNGSLVRGPRTPFDVRRTLPPPRAFWRVYASGTLQNFPVSAGRRLATTGNYVFNLTQLSTNTLPTGDYILTVKATDVCGNAGTLSLPLNITNPGGHPSNTGPSSADAR